MACRVTTVATGAEMITADVSGVFEAEPIIPAPYLPRPELCHCCRTCWWSAATHERRLWRLGPGSWLSAGAVSVPPTWPIRAHLLCVALPAHFSSQYVSILFCDSAANLFRCKCTTSRDLASQVVKWACRAIIMEVVEATLSKGVVAGEEAEGAVEEGQDPDLQIPQSASVDSQRMSVKTS